VHTDARAAESARAVNALAYTVGSHIAFGAGQHAPHSDGGRRLLAHELTHVGQQSDQPIQDAPLTLGAPDSRQEREAESGARHFADRPSAIAAVRPAQGLSPTRSAVVQRIGPAAAAAGGAAAGAIAAIISFEAALNYGRSLATRFPGWLNVLPNCPCLEREVQADPVTWGADKNPALGWFHPGAAASYRSNATYSTGPGTAHGQQCTYDSAGNLITEGPGAGTPDSWSPNTNGMAHTWYDVASWQLLGWRIYNQYWRPNNGNSCRASRGDNTFMRRLSEFIP